MDPLQHPLQYNYLQNLDIWGHFIAFSFEKAMNALIKVNKTFRILVETQYRKLFDESKQLLDPAVYMHDYTVLFWGGMAQTVTKDKIEEILQGRYRKGYTVSPALPIFKFAFECDRWDCAKQIFQRLTPHDKGIVLMSEITSNENFTRYLLEKRTQFNVSTLYVINRLKIAQLCETVEQFPNELRRYYVELFLDHLTFDVCYEEYKKRYLTN